MNISMNKLKELTKAAERIGKLQPTDDENGQHVEAFVAARLCWALAAICWPEWKRQFPYEYEDAFDEDSDIYVEEIFPMASERMDALTCCDGTANWKVSYFRLNEPFYYPANGLDMIRGAVTPDVISEYLPDELEESRTEVAEYVTDYVNNNEEDESIFVFYVNRRLGRLMKKIRKRKSFADDENELVSLCERLCGEYATGETFFLDDVCVIAGLVDASDCAYGWGSFIGPGPAAILLPKLIDETVEAIEEKIEKRKERGKKATGKEYA